jgi:type III pantothenate kinase
MLLAIDVGNTNTGFAVFSESGEQKGAWRAQSNMNRTADEYAAWLYPLFNIADLDFKDIKSIVIASVVPDTKLAMMSLCQKFFEVEPVYINADMISKLGIDIALDKPSEAGADRLVNALAVKQKYGSPSILVDFGTATNFDIVNERGEFIGGVIAPGVNLSCDALYRASAKLPRIDIHPPESAIGSNTIDAMRSGIYWGYVSLIEGLIKRCTEELSSKPHVIATGGLARIFSDHLPSIQHVDQDITTYGLFLIHQKLKEHS